MTDYIHICGEPVLGKASPAFRRAVEIVRNKLMVDKMSLQAMALHAQTRHAEMRAERGNQRGLFRAPLWAEYSRKIYVLETRVMPLLEYLQNPEVDTTCGWRGRLLEGVPFACEDCEFERNMDAEACVMLGEFWLDLSQWRENRPFDTTSGLIGPKPPSSPTGLRRRVQGVWSGFQQWRQDMGDWLP